MQCLNFAEILTKEEKKDMTANQFLEAAEQKKRIDNLKLKF